MDRDREEYRYEQEKAWGDEQAYLNSESAKSIADVEAQEQIMSNCITIPFLPEFEERILSGQKIATTRTKKYGNAGDLFAAFGHSFQLTKVNRIYLGVVRSEFYKQEGFVNQSEFVECWNQLHPRKKYHSSNIVWLHQFKRVV